MAEHSPSHQNSATALRSGNLVLHPFFFGLFPVFSLLSANLVWASFREAFLPAVVILAIALLLWLLLWPILPDARKRGLVISLFWLPFFSYGVVVDFLRDRLDFHDMLGRGQVAGIGLVALLFAAALLYGLRRSRWTFTRLTTALNRLSTFMLAIALLSCLVAMARGRATGEEVAAVPVRLDAAQRAQLPNVYFILCDAYPRADHLQEYFGFDNMPFLSHLRERGFFVADRSRSNYCHTLPSLASTLNLDYLDPSIVPRKFSENYPLLIPLVRDNLVVRTLRAHDYEFVAIASGLFPTKMENADRFIRPGAFNNTEYQQNLIDMTPVRSIMNRMDQLLWYQLVPFTLDTLSELRSESRPMFVFAHLLAPHLPHAYDKDGNFVETFPPYKEGWRTVTEFLNKRLVEVVDDILRNEPNSIIVILGDHGSNAALQSPEEYAENPWRGEWRDYVRDRSANLLTVYVPGKSPQELFYPELTPVNLFRIIFDTYLQADYGKLEDVTWITPQNSRELVRVTEVF
jgi:hypothetical protein